MNNFLNSLGLLSAFLLVLISNSANAEPVKHVCQTANPDVEVRFVGTRGDKIELHNKRLNAAFHAHAEGVDEMGGKAGELNCGDVFSVHNFVVIRTGWGNDYAHMLGHSTPADGKFHVYQYRWLPNDHPIDVIRFIPDSSAVQLRNGRDDDRYYTVCFLGDHFAHSVSANQFTGGWQSCNRDLEQNQFKHFIADKKSDNTIIATPVPTKPPNPVIAGCGCSFPNGTRTANFVKKPIGYHLIKVGDRVSLATLGAACNILTCSGGQKISNGDLSMTVTQISINTGLVFDFVLTGKP